ncbi:MAG: response regulator [Bacteroidota bacterium]
MQNIDWVKEALGFFVDLYPIKQQRDFEVIYRQSTLLVEKYAHAQFAALVQLEDAVTARVLYSSGSSIERFLDADVIGSVLRGKDIVIDAANLLKVKDAGITVLIPVQEKTFAAAFVLFFPRGHEVNEAFTQFLSHIWVGLKETTMLLQTYYAIEELGTRFNAILTTIPEGIVFVDDSGKRGWVNAAASQLLGISEESNSPTVIAGAMNQLRNAAINQEAILREGAKLFQSPNQSIRGWEWIFGSPVTKVLQVSCVPANSAHVAGRLWVFNDVTELYLAGETLKVLNAELAEKRKIADDQNKAKSDFLANMSHEIRTPMNGVIGMASLLVNTDLTDEQQDFVDTIRISGEALLSIINDILDFSKIESGKMDMECLPVNISSVIEETYDLLAVKANEKGLDLLYYIGANVPQEILGDVVRLKQILVNLVANSLKFTEKGEVLITVDSLGYQDGVCNLQFTVKDTGIGIPKEKFYKLFESFSQVDASTTRKYGGTGLGLVICQRLVTMMGGDIHAESEEGKGSSFIFNISVPESRRAIHYNSREKADNAALKDKRVLVLDDNKTNLKILKSQCGMWGMQPEVYDHYADALQALDRQVFDLVIIDMLMPEKDGIEVSQIIKERRPELPVILFSSAGYFPMHDKASKQLFAAILNKPLKQVHLERALIDVLSKGVRERSAAPAPVAASAASEQPFGILVAEDNDINQKMIMRALEKLGYKGDLAENGQEALEKMEHRKYQLVFMDVMMPVMDGYEATKLIHQRYPGADRPVIIAMTANALTGDREKILAEGMDDYVSKPFKIQDIKDKLDTWKHKLLQKI